MYKIDLADLRTKLDRIVHDYLYQVSSLENRDYFSDDKYIQAQTTVLHKLGFSVLTGKKSIPTSKEDAFLEGSTRVFLINPIIKHLLDIHQIENDWRYGATFAKYTLSNREYELDAFVEFVIVHDGRNIGCRFTPNSYPTEETYVMNRDYDYLYKHLPIPDFDRLSQIDELWVLDWAGLSAEELKKRNNPIPGGRNLCTYISLPDFFKTLFSTEIYEMFFSVSKDAISQANDLIALKAVPQLRPSNLLSLKKAVLADFSEEAVAKFEYDFKDASKKSALTPLSEADSKLIDEAFFDQGLRNSIVGGNEFAHSFLTSEYLYKTITGGLSIDYTAVVVGYLKSVEQLLYLYYLSAYGPNTHLTYWDQYNNSKKFDPTKPFFRYEPYNQNQQWMQRKYRHKKGVGDNAPEIGKLIYFLRYYDLAWNISEDGKEYVFACLDDYRDSCRNSLLHKDNIGPEDYATVKRIRKNTLVCLYYVLGAFKLLDQTKQPAIQLGIADYSFDDLYQLIWQRRRRLFWVKGLGNYEGVIIYQYHSMPDRYDASGRLDGAKLQFIKCPGISEDAVYSDEIENLRSDETHIANNTVYISRDAMPLEIRPIQARRRRNTAKS